MISDIAMIANCQITTCQNNNVLAIHRAFDAHIPTFTVLKRKRKKAIKRAVDFFTFCR